MAKKKSGTQKAKVRSVAPKNGSNSSARFFVSWLGKHKLIVLLILIILVGGGLWAKRQVEISQERERYRTAETTIDSVITDIYRQIGKADVTSLDKHCAHASRKFEKGPLSCSFSHELVYPVQNSDEAEQKARKVNGFIRQFRSLSPTHPEISNLNFFDNNRDNLQTAGFTFRFNDFANPDCSFKYSYFPPDPAISMTITSRSPKNLSIAINCGGYTKDSYYPVIR